MPSDAQRSHLAFPSKLGFGASGLGTLYRDVSEREAAEVLAEAYETGFRYFDTSPFYGHGLSELRLGSFLRTVPRDSVMVSTKAGRYLVPPYGEKVDYGWWAAPLRLKPVFDYSYDGTMRSLEQSASRVGITDFDLVYIHDVDRFTHGADFERRFDEAVEGCYRALSDLRKGGFIKAVGVGVNESDVATQFVKACRLDAVMIAGRYTLLDQSALVDLFPAAKACGNSDRRRRGLQLRDPRRRPRRARRPRTTMALRLRKSSTKRNGFRLCAPPKMFRCRRRLSSFRSAIQLSRRRCLA